MSKISKLLLATLLAVLVIALSFGAGYAVSQGALPFSLTGSSTKLPAEFDILEEVWSVLSQDYVDKTALDPAKLSPGAVKGMLEALGDPYTSHLDAGSYQLMLQGLHGEFQGIGAWVNKEQGELVVVDVIENSPAQRAGIRAGDRILEIDGVPTSGMSLTEAVLKIRGEEGTTVRLLILPEGGTASDAKEIPIIRERIQIPSVRGEMKDQLAYIRITQFSDNTNQELISILPELISAGAEGIILDLRHNFGGILSVVVKVASQFLAEGKVVLYQIDNEGKEDTWRAEGGGIAIDLPIVVLVDKTSASGSEVLAGALQAQERALLIGTTTFGKGSVNTLLRLQNGSAIYFTTARWLTPTRQRIEGLGLTPDFGVPRTEEDIEKGEDPQLQFAIERLNQQIQSSSEDP